MQNKNLLIAILIVVVAAGLSGYIYFTKIPDSSVPEENQEQENGGSFTTLPEQVSQEKRTEYIEGEVYLAALPIGAAMVAKDAQRTNVFGLQGQICVGFNLKKPVPSGNLATVLYDTEAKTEARAKSVYYADLDAGERFGCEETFIPAGNYEYKLYIGDALVANLPFKIK